MGWGGLRGRGTFPIFLVILDQEGRVLCRASDVHGHHMAISCLDREKGEVIFEGRMFLGRVLCNF